MGNWRIEETTDTRQWFPSREYTVFDEHRDGIATIKRERRWWEGSGAEWWVVEFQGRDRLWFTSYHLETCRGYVLGIQRATEVVSSGHAEIFHDIARRTEEY
jgi:hypothetical protein